MTLKKQNENPRLRIAMRLQLKMACWAAKRPANEPLTGLFTSPLTAQFWSVTGQEVTGHG